MEFIQIEKHRGSPRVVGVKLSVVSQKKKSEYRRLTLSFGSDVLAAVSWITGDKVAVAFGTEGVKSILRVNKDDAGYTIHRCGHGVAGYVWLTIEASNKLNKATPCTYTIKDGTVYIDLPQFAAEALASRLGQAAHSEG